MFKELFCEIFLTCAMAVTAPLTQEELMHRAVLFDAYQNDYAGAFVDALVFEELGLVESDHTAFALTKASLAVQQGLYEHAVALFAAIETQPLTEGDRLRLVLERARLHHRRGDSAALAAELSKIPADATESGLLRHSELIYLQADLLVNQRRFTAAGRLIEVLETDDRYRAYALFNMAMALRDANRAADAFDVLRVLLAMPGTEREVRDLKDRSRIALAHLSAELDRGDDAAALLEDLPADSRYRNSALSAFGAYALQVKDYDLAARLFQAAVHTQPWPTEAAYAQIAFPMALQGMTEPALVLGHYRDAQQRLERRVAVLVDVQKALHDRSFMTRLVRATTSEANPSLLVEVTAPWSSELPRQTWIDWMAADGTSTAVSRWLELEALHRFAAEEVPVAVDRIGGTTGDHAEADALAGRAVGLRDRLEVALRQAEDQLAEQLAERIQMEIERVKGYLLTADLALAQASDQVAVYARQPIPVTTETGEEKP
jgi:hypothetical protein